MLDRPRRLSLFLAFFPFENAFGSIFNRIWSGAVSTSHKEKFPSFLDISIESKLLLARDTIFLEKKASFRQTLRWLPLAQ